MRYWHKSFPSKLYSRIKILNFSLTIQIPAAVVILRRMTIYFSIRRHAANKNSDQNIIWCCICNFTNTQEFNSGADSKQVW